MPSDELVCSTHQSRCGCQHRSLWALDYAAQSRQCSTNLMRLIDILNGLHFAGADFFPALEAAQSRRRSLTPILRQVLSYAATEPNAYEWRFTSSLLNASAFLLAEWEDSEFLSLARPLLSMGDHPNLFGYYPEDSARLIARAAHGRCRDVIACLLDERCTETFAETLLEATVYVVAWYPESRDEVVKNLNGLLRLPMLGDFSENVHQSLVESCCRIGPTEFLLDLYLASGEGILSEKLITDWTTDRSKSQTTDDVWLDPDCKNAPISTSDLFLLEHWAIFDACELFNKQPLTDLEVEALIAFNSVAVPCHDLDQRLAKAAKVPGIEEISLRVVRLASEHPEHVRAQHWHTAVSAAICLGSLSGGSGFGNALIRLLQLPEDFLERLLNDDLTEMCTFALALASRDVPTDIYRLIEDTNAYFASRAVALEALHLQVRLGFLSRDELAKYLLGLFTQSDILAGNPLFWSSIADIGAHLSISEMLPFLLDLDHAGTFIEPDGTIYMDDRYLEELFLTPPPLINLPDFCKINAVYLLGRCAGHKAMSVRNFINNLEPPNYTETL